MKKTLIFIFVSLILLTSCTARYTFTENPNGSLTRSDKNTFYPIESSYRYADFSERKKLGKCPSGEVWSIDDEGLALLVIGENSERFYLTEEYSHLDILFEECNEYFFAPEKDLDKYGRVSEKYISEAVKLTGDEAVDFAFYIFYGRSPDEEGLGKGKYVGEIIALFDDPQYLVSSYPVYRYGKDAFSVEIDGDEYLLEEKWAKAIGII